MNNGQFQPTGFRVLPPVVKNLLILNGLFFLATLSFGSVFHIDLTDILGLHYFQANAFRPYQLITYMFMHGSFSHILFNMFALWMFGGVLENLWGPKRFLIYFLVTGIGAALVHYGVLFYEINPVVNAMDSFIAAPDLIKLQHFLTLHQFQISENSGEMWQNFMRFKADYSALVFDPKNVQALQGTVNFITDYRESFLNMPVVIGASGAVFGLLLAFGMLFPNSLIYIYFFIPMKAKWFVILYGAIELFSGFYNTQSNVAHFAHLGGMLFGYFLIIYWKKNPNRNSY
jgi:membrane associated rhomboid family serine protease